MTQECLDYPWRFTLYVVFSYNILLSIACYGPLARETLSLWKLSIRYGPVRRLRVR